MCAAWGGIGPYNTYRNLGLYGALDVYGSVQLTETSPPQAFVEPLTLDEVKSFLKVPARSPADTLEDALISSLITGARARAEAEQCRDLVRKQIDLSFDYWPSYRIVLGAPLVSVDQFSYLDSDGNTTILTKNVDFIVDNAKQPGLVTPPYNKTWPTFSPWPSSSILLRFTSGYGPNALFWSDLGAHVKNGMRLLISDWYHNRLPFDAPKEQYPGAVNTLLSYGARTRVS